MPHSIQLNVISCCQSLPNSYVAKCEDAVGKYLNAEDIFVGTNNHPELTTYTPTKCML